MRPVRLWPPGAGCGCSCRSACSRSCARLPCGSSIARRRGSPRSSDRVAARVCTAVVAVALIAWLGVMERGVRLQASGVEAAERHSWARADEDFRRARLLTPDTLPDVRRALVFQGSGRTGRALAVLDDGGRREAANPAPWRFILAFAGDRDPAVRRRAPPAIPPPDPIKARRLLAPP